MTQLKNGETFRVAMLVGAGAVLGSLLGYFLDPDRGGRRRAILRDKTVHSKNRAMVHGRRLARRMKNRAVGLGVQIVKSMRGEGIIEDDRLRERVRSWLGHHVEHPRMLHVEVKNGIVTLSGLCVGLEPTEVVDFVRDIEGVRQVVNRISSAEQQFFMNEANV